MVPVCSGCGEKIKDAFILRVSPDMVWHAACLQCSDCHCNLADNPTCFLRDGKMYCKTDYVRLFSMKCAHCQETLQSSDLVLRAQGEVYHQDCFRCSDCHCQLLPGDLFTFQPQGLHCITHRQLEQERERNEISDAREDNQNTQQYPGICPNYSPKSEVVLKQPAEKLSRMRTVLNEQQLQALRTCYSMNPRPDAILKEKLVEVTGLSPRVIRVWFQNKRCKDKKRALMMQQSQKHPSEIQSLRGVVGTRMVARSPKPQDEHAWCPVEVTSCRWSWQLLSESFLTAEGAAFSQMVGVTEPDQMCCLGYTLP
uniref:Insulin gene enhancer protein ISL-2A-like n=1 Tax=Geotrypetes seraphini TaxID=260995 RepID=A0A6P8S879_GEOSA|nr:insulin gene enhancer protein ISL-2A-like [Geotrypetes seraphini]